LISFIFYHCCPVKIIYRELHFTTSTLIFDFGFQYQKDCQPIFNIVTSLIFYLAKANLPDCVIQAAALLLPTTVA